MLVEKLFCSFFNPLVSLYIYYGQYEKIWRKNKIIFFPRFVSMEMVTIFHFRALTKVHMYLKTASSNAVKSCTHIEDMQMKKRTEAFLLLLHNTFLIIFCVKNTTKIRQKIQILLNKKIRMFKEISFCTFLEYYSIGIHSKFHSILPRKWPRKWYRNTTFS